MADVRALDLPARIRESLRDPELRAALERATASAWRSPAELAAALPPWPALRARAAAVRRQTLEHLDRHLEAFETACARTGIQVHWARDAAEACAHVLALARRHGATTVVKSKSMVTEEIGLNAYLERNGVEAVETDLGEFIVQLAGQAPSHITAPALHLSRQAIGRLFAAKLGVEPTDDPAALTAIARRALRARLLAARLGISGVNFGLAREGGFVVVENECNATLTMTLPRVHVAVMGLERLLPSLDDLPVFLKLLPLSATGQKMTSYVSYVRGPAAHGPEAVHVILVDNGRTRILADPARRELLQCIRCGACLNVCPVYRRVGGHAYGWVYPGPIGATLIPLFLGLDEGRHAPFASSLCGACREVCPVGIDLPRHLLALRHEIARARKTGWAERAAVRLWALAARRPGLYRMLAALARLAGGRLPAPAWRRTRDFPRLAKTSFAALWDQENRRS